MTSLTCKHTQGFLPPLSPFTNTHTHTHTRIEYLSHLELAPRCTQITRIPYPLIKHEVRTGHRLLERGKRAGRNRDLDVANAGIHLRQQQVGGKG
ncbi:uncharacterized protein LY79DRAFT_554090 [Colletotrichum navitas]|uniref:Uncharacterized protein n=1 Tax=Colletotrichum navitas TaxID=681940 RepID=A0AAD8PYN0_9PEZI|nr:uncharacterized protein LY79DRAFT_554090 [Colletotrichum navitas]KAK1590534.1 hypothetical protein LY79DRAFT_554090 [Colletotrichum navitas]